MKGVGDGGRGLLVDEETSFPAGDRKTFCNLAAYGSAKGKGDARAGIRGLPPLRRGFDGAFEIEESFVVLIPHL